MSRFERVLLPLGCAVLLVWLWSYWAQGGGGGATDFPTPREVLRGYGHLLKTAPGENAPRLVQHVVASVFRTTFGFLAAVALGIPLGLWLGWSARARQSLDWLVQMLRPISAIAWIPIGIMIFRQDDMRSVLLIFIAAFFPIVVSTTAAVRSIPTMYLRAARNFGLGGYQLMRQVVLPASMPQIVLAMRISAAISWIVVVAAEMFGVQGGLGWLIIDARYQGARTDLIVGTMIVIGLIGWGIDLALRRLEDHPRVSWGYPERG